MNINYFMNIAKEEAKKAYLLDEVPIGAVLVDNINNSVICKSHNEVNIQNNSIKHAEIILIENACNKRKSKNLSGTSIFVTLEPCIMCAAAISNVRINKVYFGAYDEQKGSLESIIKIYNQKGFFVPEVYGGINELDCSQLIKNFFKNKRS